MAIPSIPDFSSLVAQMVGSIITLAPQITDFVPGSVIRSITESDAIEQQRLAYALFSGIKEGIQTGTFRAFSFNRLSATPATGKVTFTRASGTGTATIPAGLQVKVPNSSRVYATTTAVSYADGETAKDASIRCLTAGSIGNTPAHTITEIIGTPGFTTTVDNAKAVSSGLGEESESERLSRFQIFIQSLAKGTNPAILFAARSVQLTDVDGNVIERVQAALVHEPVLDTPRGHVGVVDVFVDNGSGTASQDLLTLVFNTIRGFVEIGGSVQRGFIAAGIDLNVFGVGPVELDVTGVVAVADGYDETVVADAVATSITNYLLSLQVFQVAVVSEIIAAAMDVPGVTDFTLTTPTANTTVKYNQRVVPGTMTIL